MVLDSYIVKAIATVTVEQLFDAFAKLYPEYMAIRTEYEAEMQRWLKKLRETKPGLALSTGRRNSLRGEFTCALLDALGVQNPRAERNRMDLAWAILDSPVGRQSIGVCPELDAERRAGRG